MDSSARHTGRVAIPAVLIFLLILILLFAPRLSQAASFYVRDAVIESNIDPGTARAATTLVRDAVASRSGDMLVDDEYRADYSLQPRLMSLGTNMILTVEKIRGQDVLFAAQSKFDRIEQLDRVARGATYAAIDQPSTPSMNQGHSVALVEPAGQAPYRVVPPTTLAPVAPVAPVQQPAPVVVLPPGGRSVAQPPGVAVLPVRKINYWTIGVGPFVPRYLKSDAMMYDFTLGHTWDINPRASVKILGEANFSSGGEDARFYNLGTGATYFLPGSINYAPYLTADIGYGWARDTEGGSSEGFSFGTGAGFQFFRTTETTMDLLLRYAVILDSIEGAGGNPSVVGARLAVNF